VVGTSPSWAQTTPPADTSIDVQLFDYAIGPKTFVTVNDGTIQAPKQFSLDFLVTFLTDPYSVYNVSCNRNSNGGCDDSIIGTRTAVVSSLAAGQITGAYGLNKMFHIGASLPMVFTMNGDGLDPATAMPTGEGYRVAGLGDLRVELKAKLWEKDEWAITAAPVVTVPTSIGGNGGDFMGDDLPTFRGYGAGQWRHPSGRFAAGANLGFILRKPREIYASTISQQMTYAGAVMYQPSDTVSLIAEGFGRTGLTTRLDTDNSPFELNGSARIRINSSFNVLAGAGTGLVQAIGSPKFRFFASIGWSPDFGDTDGDGIDNMKDGCPLVAEDKDGFEDADGCPDTDNDRDLREDSEDKCPNEAEDKDGFEDDDGCPEPDNDQDGFLDGKDRCPQDKEDGIKPYDKDGCPAGKSDIDQDGIMDDRDQCIEQEEDFDEFEDWDGCPEADNDGDGVPDADDQCPLCREDKDGFDDEDGCPEPDNDGDGVLDGADKCPDQQETVNGVSDDDGCPDSGGSSLASLDGDRIDYKGAIELKGNKLRTGSKKILGQVGAIMRGQGAVTKWRVVVAIAREATEAETKIKAQARAQVIKNELLAAGVPAEKIEAIGIGADRELVAFSVIERSDPVGSKGGVCPAGSAVEPRAKPDGAAAPASGGGSEDSAESPASDE